MRAARRLILPIVAGALVVPATTASATTPGDAVAPLTGLAADPAIVARPALVVALDTCCADGLVAQAGLAAADLVFEYEADGTTALDAVFHADDADLVGPIRPARATSADLLGALGTVVVAADDGTDGVNEELAAAGHVVVGPDDGMTRVDIHPAPHDLFVATGELWAQAGDAEPAVAPFAHDAAVPVGEVASFVPVTFATLEIEWEYDVEAEVYFRRQHGAQHTLVGDAWVIADNVVVAGVEYVAGAVDPDVPEAVTVGSGPVTVHRNGVAVTGEWSRASATDPFTLTDAAGAAIALAPGRTWVELTGPLPAP